MSSGKLTREGTSLNVHKVALILFENPTNILSRSQPLDFTLFASAGKGKFIAMLEFYGTQWTCFIVY